MNHHENVKTDDASLNIGAAEFDTGLYELKNQ